MEEEKRKDREAVKLKVGGERREKREGSKKKEMREGRRR